MAGHRRTSQAAQRAPPAQEHNASCSSCHRKPVGAYAQGAARSTFSRSCWLLRAAACAHSTSKTAVNGVLLGCAALPFLPTTEEQLSHFSHLSSPTSLVAWCGVSVSKLSSCTPARG